jgi:hypothetical protein
VTDPAASDPVRGWKAWSLSRKVLAVLIVGLIAIASVVYALSAEDDVRLPSGVQPDELAGLCVRLSDGGDDDARITEVVRCEERHDGEISAQVASAEACPRVRTDLAFELGNGGHVVCVVRSTEE